jgi:predicted O-linked N-acetylglucosamine transferase (SPINDLY family)
MNDGTKRNDIFSRITRGVRSVFRAEERSAAAAPVLATAQAPAAAERPLHAKDLIDEGLRERQQHGAAAAIALFERAAQLEPNSYLPILMLGNAASELGDIDKATDYYTRARDLEPKNHIIRYNLGLNLLSQGYMDAAIGELAGAAYLDPRYAPAPSAFIMALHYSDKVPPDEISAAIRQFGTSFAAQHPASALAARTDRNPNSRLRVGFISADFRTHSVAHFFEPILSARDRNKFEYLLYSNSSHHDAVSERLQGYADIWRDVRNLGDDALIDLIRADCVDILVDLGGHTEANRLAVFARRAAPVQLTYLGFPNSTGLPTMDFRITDAATDPYPVADGWHTEKLLRLPDAQWCFRPFGAPPPPGPLPARNAGFVTFGSFNNLTKASDTLLACWARILVRLPTSRIRLSRVRSPKRAAEIVAYFAQSGVTGDRIDCTPYRQEVPYGLQYEGVDIALDAYPYNGVTTTCESLFVGVPVISLHGGNCVSRSGLSILNTVGLGELVASTPEQYVDVAVALASDLTRLEKLRGELRGRFEQSPLRDEKRFAAHFEELLQRAWRHHSSGPKNP